MKKSIRIKTVSQWYLLKQLNDCFGKRKIPMEVMRKVYHIKEDKSISMGDETVKIFLNTDGTMDDVSEELKAFLDYVAGKKTKDSYVEKLEEAVKEAKKNREWRHEYMTLLMRDQENVELGEKIGEKRGEERLAQLILLLNEDGRSSDVIRVLQDREYRQELYMEYHII